MTTITVTNCDDCPACWVGEFGLECNLHEEDDDQMMSHLVPTWCPLRSDTVTLHLIEREVVEDYSIDHETGQAMKPVGIGNPFNGIVIEPIPEEPAARRIVALDWTEPPDMEPK